ncbi:protein-glutamate methylesterase/protein-glutamine glutaminase [Ethanoligenens harbinense]|uniref:Protein-glutamate methylesterase/protein-glutamine glutaminase n=1 Tax=Ethanoligenens harbinense (strain DSM 18485 / JCM 12961 / CGMCC 1.5033 / YUAN-3) TaxID=663278 RepID=E6U6G6_ETHHY|nr:chemotaxis response regulator protein-glutamate methylesterase [Ethanoligenens harbinense]ADU28036.1 response regulator receiver modulated CheB methylesterase [Ethanoligenens harbinense YUAN-3]AVQ97055.1 chemotaxis response regulator protein-glutamate methylesterase [Ethanoligenens harbinense YUAN-3]AYF39716.1 chemotaxis response regulator protein-glutamate methylesterase [Ethanoligenens harbinense]AYF42549.1 chemotaxis response regulator protein-glutamate methylesterase [Ethanoligenens harb
MEIKHRIRVLVVDDSIVFREVLVRGLSQDPVIEVVGTAQDAFTARERILQLEPDVMTLDIEMPRMSGVEFLHQIMAEHPLPAVLVSSANATIFDALDAGAVDFVAKPDVSQGGSMQAFIQQMIIKIKIASTAKVGRYKKSGPPAAGQTAGRVIAIGASTGGTEAILAVLRDLPRGLPGIVIVQHMPPVFTRMYAERLNNICKLEVAEAKNGDAVLPGKALIAPGGFQMRLVKDKGGYAVRVLEGERVNGHAPSVDVLFDSVAETAGKQAVGIILTGMGGDGAKGLLHMREKGAYTIGQDEKSCVVYGMPMVAYNLGAVAKQAPLSAVADELLRFLHG